MNLIRFATPTHPSYSFPPLSQLAAFGRDIDHLFDLPAIDRNAGSTGAWSPVLDLHQDENTLFITVELPGMKKEEITLSLHGDVLTLAGERTRKKDDTDEIILRNERFFGRFERKVTLPIQVDGSRVNAVYEDGILIIALPKAEAAKPRQIEIGVK